MTLSVVLASVVAALAAAQQVTLGYSGAPGCANLANEGPFPSGSCRTIQGNSYVVTCNDALAPTGGRAAFYLSGSCSGIPAYTQTFTNGACLGFSPLVPQIRSITYTCAPAVPVVPVVVVPTPVVVATVAPLASAPPPAAPLPSPAASQGMLDVKKDTSGGSSTVVTVCSITVAICSAFMLAVQRL